MRERETIFVVDDSETNLVVAKEALENKYKVITISSGERCIKILEQLVPDLILLDVEMPNLNGYDTLRLIKQNERIRNVPVIFLTARNDPSSEVEGFELGAVDYILKPFSVQRLLKRVEIHLLNSKHMIKLDNLVREKVNELVILQNNTLGVIADLVEARDSTTGDHIERTQTFLEIFLDQIYSNGAYADEVSSWDIYYLLPSAQLHDVGKIKISDIILNKPGKLTDEEFNIMKTHSAAGEEIIDRIIERTGSSSDEFLKYARLFAGTHHEKVDGSGYPRGLKGNEIPLQGRILAIVDVYDALVSLRPYKKPMTHTDAVKIIVEGSGKHFDTKLIDVFLECEKRFDRLHVQLSR
jgi:putative two-component system response regulator